MRSSCATQATNDADNWVFYTPNGPDKKLIGSDFTSFFLAAVDNPKLNGMRLKKVGSLSSSNQITMF